MKYIIRISLVLSVLVLMFGCDKNADNGFVDDETPPSEVVTGRNLEVEFTTTAVGGQYAPHHILAAWIEQEDGTFIRSLKVRAEERIQYLTTWKSASDGDKTDAITGATLTSHTTHNVNWNLQTKDLVDINNGNYNLMIESTDRNSKGKVGVYPFTYSDSIMSQSFDDIEVYKDVSITYSETVE